MVISILIFIVAITLIIVILLQIQKAILNYRISHKTYINDNTVILITGGCSGIGRELIKQFYKYFNCKIINIDIQKDLFPSLMEEFKGKKLINIYCDLSTPNINFENLLKSNKIDIKNLDIIINNAGIAHNKNFDQLTINELNKTAQINLLTPINLIKTLLENKKKNLHIVTIASIMSHIISNKSSDYIMSKWGLFGFHESVRSEYLYNKNNIYFTIFCPFTVNTKLFKGFKNPLPFIFRIYEANEIADYMVKCILLKKSVVYIPWYSGIVCSIYKMLPNFMTDFVQYTFCKNI